MLTAWALVAAAAPCDLAAPPDAPFQVRPEEAGAVRVLIEVWATPESLDWASETLGALGERGLTGTLVVPLPDADGPSDPLLQALRSAARAGHEVAVHLPAREVPRDLGASMRPFRARLKAVRKAARGVQTAASPLPGKPSEALLGRAGFHSFLALDGPPVAAPRYSAVFEGEPRVNVVLPAGPYAGPCGSEPDAGAFTPRAADRAAQAIHGALASPGAPMVRVVLNGSDRQSTDAAVLGRWIDEVLRPAGVQITTPSEARRAALQALRASPEGPSKPPALGGRIMSVEDVLTAAQALEGVQILPRTLPGEIALTEAFQAFLRVLAGASEGDMVRLAALKGPPSHAPSVLGQEEVVEIPREAVLGFARALMTELPDEVPVSMRVGGKLLTAPELLLLLGSAVRGEDPSVTRIAASPDPNAPGQGWGSATVP